MLNDIKEVLYASARVICLFSVLAVCYFIFIKEPLGYCRNENKFLSDKDFMRSALISMKGVFESNDAAHKFYLSNPYCCGVYRPILNDRYSNLVDVGNSFFFSYKNNIIVNIALNITDIAKKDSHKLWTKSPYLIKVEIDPCGHVVRSLGAEIGESEYNAYIAKHRGDSLW
jgi:hypothetical protein